MKCFKYGLLILLMKAGSCLAAQQLMPSPAQIEQFKSLSAEEKQALARSVGIDPASNDLLDGFDAQAHQVFRNLRAVCQAAGSDLDEIVRSALAWEARTAI